MFKPILSEEMENFFKNINKYGYNELFYFSRAIEACANVSLILNNILSKRDFYEKTGKLPVEIRPDYMQLGNYFIEKLIPILSEHYLTELQEIFYNVLLCDEPAFQVGHGLNDLVMERIKPEMFTKKMCDDILYKIYNLFDLYPFLTLIPENLLDKDFYVKMVENTICDEYGYPGYYLVPEEYRNSELYKKALLRTPFIIEHCEEEPFVNQDFIDNLFTDIVDNQLVRLEELEQLYNNLPEKFKSQIVNDKYTQYKNLNTPSPLYQNINKDFDLYRCETGEDVKSLCKELLTNYSLEDIFNNLEKLDYFLIFVDEEMKTDEFYTKLLNSNVSADLSKLFKLYPLLPEKYTTEANWILFMSYLLEGRYIYFDKEPYFPDYIRNEIIFKKVCEINKINILKNDYEYSYYYELAKIYGDLLFKIIPYDKIDKDLVMRAISIEPSDVNEHGIVITNKLHLMVNYEFGWGTMHTYESSIRFVPEEFIDDDVINYLRSINALYFNYDYLPEKYKTEELLKEKEAEMQRLNDNFGVTPLELIEELDED